MGGRKIDVTSKLSTIYEDDEIVVYTAPNEDQLKALILELLSKHDGMTLRDLHSYLSGLASEDKIRQALNSLMNDGNRVIQRDGKYYLAELVEYDDYYGGDYGDYGDEYEYYEEEYYSE